MSYFKFCLTFCLVCWSISLWSHHRLPPGFVIEEVTSQLNLPTSMAFAPDGRIFITEKSGAVRIIENGILLDAPFYEVETQTPNERGLLNVTLDPNFDDNGYVYLFYTIKDALTNKVARVTAAGNGAIPGSEIELIRFDDMWGAWHNGGAMVFDDGTLIISVGDGTNGPKAPKMSELLGKIVRINPDGSIPEDNPYYNELEGRYRSITAYGLRNGYTMARSRTSGRIFLCDVGNTEYEEINEYIPGSNYGWNRVEGPLPQGMAPPDENYQDPIYSYIHNDSNCAIVGAAFYEPNDYLFPEQYHGKFFFMEYCEGKIFYMDPETYEVDTFASHFDFVNNLSVSPDGHLYIMQLATGQLYRVSYIGSGAPFVSKHPQSIVKAVGDSAVFEVEVISEGEADYTWFKNDALIVGESTPVLVVKDLMITDDQAVFTCRAENALGEALSREAVLTVVEGNYPVVTILSPDPETKYSAGDTIQLLAEATDPEDGMSVNQSVTWKIDFHHDSHTHPALSNAVGTTYQYVVGRSGEVDTNVFYRVYASVEDLDGLQSESTIDLLPRKISMPLFSEPAGIILTVDGAAVRTNTEIRSVNGLWRTIEIPVYQVYDNHLWIFDEWMDGMDSTRLRTFPAGEGLEIGARFSDAGFYHTSDSTPLDVRFYVGVGEDTVYYKMKQEHTIDDNWDVGSPYFWSTDFPRDEYSGLYRGILVPPVDGAYTFHALHDGQVTLMIGDSVLLDKSQADWTTQQTSDVTIDLKGGARYNFSLFYEHFSWVSRVQLFWSFGPVVRELVPGQHFQKGWLTTGVDTVTPNTLLNVYPNPNTGEILNLDWQISRTERLEARIFDEHGALIRSQPLMVEGGHSQINVLDLTSGVYFLEIHTDGETLTEKFIMVR